MVIICDIKGIFALKSKENPELIGQWSWGA